MTPNLVIKPVVSIGALVYQVINSLVQFALMCRL
jgi:hypothetical protein